jgi:filamin
MPGRAGHEIVQNKDGSVTLQYKPEEAGVHELNLMVNDKQTEGTPFRCYVDAIGGGFVTAYGPGLYVGASGQNADFTVIGGGTDLDVTIDGPSKADLIRNEKTNGVRNLSYLPMSPGEYMVNITSGGKHIHGSPFSAKISGEGRKRSQLSLPATSDVELGGSDVDLTGLVGVLTSPSGALEPCLLKKMPSGKLGIASFTPKTKGTYKVGVSKDGAAYSGSPFSLEVGDSQVCSPLKVKLSGAVKDGKAQQFNDVIVDVNQAGYGSLAVSIEGANRADIQSKDNGDHTYTMGIKPHEPGLYLLNVRFGDEHVNGSPFMMNVGGQASGRVRETKDFEVKNATTIGAGSKCEFQLVIPGCDPLDMEAILASPSGKSELCTIRDLPGHIYDIKFVPKEEGVHTVSLKHKGLHIAGSPFQYTVGVCPASGSHKVEIGGPGLERGEVGDNNEFNIYTREAGAGKVQVAVEGPDKANITISDKGNGFVMVSYKTAKEGEYGIHIKFNDEHVPDSPVMVNITPESKDAKKCSVHGIKDRGLEIGKPSQFRANTNGGVGEIFSTYETPSGTMEDSFVQLVDCGEYVLRFIPRENGVHYVTVRLNEAHIPGSPFPMLVGKMGADAALVMARGDGLTKGESGKVSKFTVVTLNSGAGQLNVQVDGPSKVAIQVLEVEEGYEFSYTAVAPGDYLINIKYCNVTIAGCPSKSVVTGAGGSGKKSDIKETSSLSVETVEKKPGVETKKRFTCDASKVEVKGNGLKKAFMNRPANFTVDAGNAGNAFLCVGIITPTGMPVQELSYKKQGTKGNNYQVIFKTAEKGEHTMTVRWGSDEVPGSPFIMAVN